MIRKTESILWVLDYTYSEIDEVVKRQFNQVSLNL